MKYDIFISYRRQGGYETALPIVEKLRRAGYRVFFDLESLNSGKFNEQLYSVIDQATDFVLVLPEGGLDRCKDEGDWVRNEIKRALQGKKNIIPVMLKGFAWPDVLPDDIGELPDFQGLSASSPEHFDLAVQRLIGYLKSKPKKPVRKWLTLGGVVLSTIVALIFAGYFTFLQLAKPVCKRVGTQMTFAMNIIHDMYRVSDEFNKTWESYIRQRQKSSVVSQERLDADFIDDVNTFYIPEIERICADYPDFADLSDYENFLIGFYNLDPADVAGLKFIVESQGQEFIDKFVLRTTVIQAKMFNTASLNTLREGDEAEENGMNWLYYGYLEFMANIPKQAWESHRQVASNWYLFPNTSETLSPEEYHQLAVKEQIKMEKAIESTKSLVEMLSNKLNSLEEYLSDMEMERTEPEDRN